MSLYKKYSKSINTFEDFYEVTKNMKKKEKGDLFEELTKYLFVYHPTLKNETDKIWLYNDFPQRYKTQLKLPDNDEGIDLMMLSKDKKWYAIQCKFRSNKNTKISWGSLATFSGLTFGVAKGIYKGIFVTNTIPITKNIINSNYIIINDIFENLDQDFFNLIKPGRKKSIICKQPRKHQTTIIEKSITHFQLNDRGYIESACGSGKTLTAYWIDKRMNNKITIVNVPSLYLLSQFYNDWVIQSSHEKDDRQFILVGSDIDFNNKSEHYNTLFLSLNIQQISDRIKWVVDKTKAKITIITTYQSSDLVINALDKLKIIPDLCIFDEAHKTAGSQNKQFNLLLHDVNMVIKKRLFMTATPKIYHGNSSDEIISMDNVKWYGKKIYLYNTYDAIKDGYLCDYQIVTMHTDNQYIKDHVKKNKLVYNQVFEDNESHYLASVILLLGAIQKGQCHHLLTYHNTIVHAKKFTQLLEQVASKYNFDVLILNIDGKMSMNKRKNVIKDFTQSKISILSSARVLNEGIDIPIIDSVCFIDSRCSTIDIVQSVGRALRKHELKNNAKIFIPVIIEDIENTDSSIYNNMIKIIKSLSDTDTGIMDYFTVRNKGSNPERSLVTYNNYFSTEVNAKIINLSEWILDIEDKIWENINIFNFKLNLLFEWSNKNERAPMHNEQYKNQNIGNWLHHQKEKINNVNDDIYQLLSKNQYVKINIDIFLEKKEINKTKIKLSVDEWHILLSEYIIEYNMTPRSKTIYKNHKLGSWYNDRKKKIHSIHDDSYKLLSKNKYVEKNLNKYLVNKTKNINTPKLTQVEWCKLLFEYSNNNKACPDGRTKYKNKNLGTWFQASIKPKINDTNHELYIQLSQNKYVKKNLDKYLKNKEINKQKIKLTVDELIILLFEYATNNKSCPSNKIKYKNQNIGAWFYTKKIKMTDFNSEMYNKLAKNEHIKENLDDYIKNKQTQI